jgi:DNA-binding response OmpR family regulator
VSITTTAPPSASIDDAVRLGVVPSVTGVVLVAVAAAGPAVVERLRRAQVPRLLLLADDEPAPLDGDPLEDWVRLPARDADVDLRVDLLHRRAARHPLALPVELDPAEGILRRGSAWVALSGAEHRFVALLLDRAAEVVDDDTIRRSTGSTDVPSAVKRLRRRLAPVGVGIHRVVGRGYLLEVRSVLRD